MPRAERAGAEPRPRGGVIERVAAQAQTPIAMGTDDQARKWLLRPAVALAAIIVAVLVLFDWNWLKEPIERRVSAELGRDVEIAGDLDVDLGLQPRITVTDVRLANPPWASDASMLAVSRAEAVVDLRALVDGEVRLPELSITEPALRLETRPDGPPNWEFPSEKPAGPPSVPHIGRLKIEGAAVHYLEHGSGQSVDAALAEVTGSTDAPDGGMQLPPPARSRAKHWKCASAGRPPRSSNRRTSPISWRSISRWARAISPATSS